MKRAALPALAFAAGLGGCLAQPLDEGPRRECTQDSQCNTAAGEVCDEGVCWGDPPAGSYAAVLGPASSYNSVAALTEVPALTLAANGWITGDGGNPLTLNTVVRVTGKVQTPCPPQLEGCSDVLQVPGTLRWSRRSRIAGLPDIPVSTTISGPAENTRDGFEMYLPRPVEPTTYTVTFTPSPMPLGPGLPSAARFLPPFRTQVVIDPAAENVERDFMVPAASTARALGGRISQVGAASLDGWQVHAEAGDGTVQGAFSLASNLAVTSAAGEFTLAIVDDSNVQIVDLVLVPPDGAITGTGPGQAKPRVRLRDHVVSTPLPTLALPAFDRVIAAPILVQGIDGSGSQMQVNGAIVKARLDQRIGAVYLRHEAEATTADGVASLQVLLGSVEVPLHYEVDVLPGPGSALATAYGIALDVADVVPSPPPIVLTRGAPLVGTVFDELGYGVAGATVTAAVSPETLCALSSEDLELARALAPVTATSDANGEFALFVDPDLAGQPLMFDMTVEPSAGTWAPRWTFRAQMVTGSHHMLWLPAAAHVRARVFDPSGNPAADTVMTLYEMTQEPAPCPQVATFGDAGLAVRRAVGRSDADGVARMILPRLP